MTLNLTISTPFTLSFNLNTKILGSRAQSKLVIFDKEIRTVLLHNIDNVVSQVFRFHVIGGFPNYVIEMK